MLLAVVLVCICNKCWNSRPLQLREFWNPRTLQLRECWNSRTLQLRECWNPRTLQLRECWNSRTLQLSCMYVPLSVYLGRTRILSRCSEAVECECVCVHVKTSPPPPHPHTLTMRFPGSILSASSKHSCAACHLDRNTFASPLQQQSQTTIITTQNSYLSLFPYSLVSTAALLPPSPSSPPSLTASLARLKCFLAVATSPS